MRVADRRCVDCNAGLQDDDGVCCVECVEKRKARSKRYLQSEKGKATRARMSREWYWKHRDEVLEGMRDKYLAMKSEAACTKCGEPAVGDHGMCAAHRERHNASCVEYRARRKAAVIAR